MRRLNRRDFLAASASSGALLLAGRPLAALAAPLQTAEGPGADRASRLTPGLRLAHADLHNHSLLSDGDGNPDEVFASMRSHGLDVAALTDHATTSKFVKPPCGDNKECHSVLGIDDASWARVAQLADAAQADGAFTAIRGFEWSSPTLGHMNVWFSQTWVDPLHTAGTSTGEGLGQHLEQGFEFIPPLPAGSSEIDGLVRQSPTNGSTMRPFYEWLTTAPNTPAIGGGADGIAGFNHPGREPGRFGYFHYDQRLRERVVSMEIFNRGEDYLFEGYEAGQPSPLVQCLGAGWRVGLIGVSDEHGRVWGNAPQKGRAGVWISELTRPGVRAGLLSRRFFATTIEGLRVDAAATAAGAPVPMGGVLKGRPGQVRFELDIDGGAAWVGKALNVQVLVPGQGLLPDIAKAVDVVVPSPTQPVISFTAALGTAPWAVLRITDPALPADKRVVESTDAAAKAYAGLGKAIAYASPFYLEA